MNNKKIITTLFLLCLAIFMIFFFKPDKKQEFQTTQGVIFGTTYHISYQTEQGVKLDTAIARAFSQIDLSLSMFNPQSTISQFNHTDSISLSDTRFNHVLIHALKISEQTHGAFDITIAPLVNLYGFGFKKQEQITDSSILFALQNVGYKKLTISNNTLYKQHPDMMLDASAIAKGYACDYVAQTLRNYNVENLLVEIGGEVMAYGNNSKGNKWRIGINRPIEDSTSTVSQIQRIVEITNAGLATSGNYRNFYIKDGQKYSHTIHPKTGYPVQHSLLSATIIAPDCMTADAFATACMVMGLEQSLRLCQENPLIEGFFIYDNNGNIEETWSEGFPIEE